MTAIVFLLIGALPQLGYLWTEKELLAKADLVVVAAHVSTEDTKRRGLHPALKPDLPVIEFESTFRVIDVKKSRRPAVERDQLIRLRHLRIDMDEWHRRNPPQGRVRGGLLNAGTELNFSVPRQVYRMYLRRLESGVYEPLSGHTFPEQSVLMVTDPRTPRR